MRYWLEQVQRNGAPGEIRTPDPLVRSQMLYPAELRARHATATEILIIAETLLRMKESEWLAPGPHGNYADRP